MLKYKRGKKMKKTDYKTLLIQALGLLHDINYEVSLLSNASALLNEALDDINWVGFYLFLDGKLILGPFQGLVACLEIPLTKGVCGACATKKETIIVEDVHKFPTHIACDSRSNSEIVLPIIINNELYGLLDIDSPSIGRFNEEDKINLEKIVTIITDTLIKIRNK